MKISLKTYAKKQGTQTMLVTLSERLPAHVHAPCVVRCTFHVAASQNDYLLHRQSTAQCQLTCQRCLTDFEYTYQQASVLAICATEERADQYMTSYDSMVVTDDWMDLTEILTDDLHLHVPSMHVCLDECDSGMLILLK